MVPNQSSCNDEAGHRGPVCNRSSIPSVSNNCMLPPYVSRQLLTAHLQVYSEDRSAALIDVEVANLSCCCDSMRWHRCSFCVCSYSLPS
uniref:Uncharacterized protein n=1 Tax=Physcomitrium patens TaxID=3218 RepID=A0A7I4AYN9_PHYPA